MKTKSRKHSNSLELLPVWLSDSLEMPPITYKTRLNMGSSISRLNRWPKQQWIVLLTLAFRSKTWRICSWIALLPCVSTKARNTSTNKRATKTISILRTSCRWSNRWVANLNSSSMPCNLWWWWISTRQWKDLVRISRGTTWTWWTCLNRCLTCKEWWECPVQCLLWPNCLISEWTSLEWTRWEIWPRCSRCLCMPTWTTGCPINPPSRK